jgi:hypothetical protein
MPSKKIQCKVVAGKTCYWCSVSLGSWTDFFNWGGVVMKREKATKIVTGEVIDLSKKRPDLFAHFPSAGKVKRALGIKTVRGKK